MNAKKKKRKEDLQRGRKEVKVNLAQLETKKINFHSEKSKKMKSWTQTW